MYEYQGIKIICITSSVAFSVLSCLCEWIKPIEKFLDFAMDISEYEHKKKSLLDEFNSAVNKALKKTKRCESISYSQKMILDELEITETEFYSLNDAIKKTETYRIRYCTNADAREIISIFDKFFLEEVINSSALNKLYVMNAQFVTLKKLEQISDIISGYSEDLNQVKYNVLKLIDLNMKKERTYSNCFNSIVYNMIAMLIFLILGIITSNHYDWMIVLSAIISCIVSDFLMVFVRLNENIVTSIILTISCFWLLIWSINMDINCFLIITIYLVVGKLVSLLLKRLYL